VGLDILTERGQQTLADLEAGVQLFLAKNPKFNYVATPPGKPAAVDAVLTKKGEVFAVVETKCRYSMSLLQLRGRFNNEWLVTMSKLTTAADVARNMCVPLYGFLYLVDDDVLCTQRIAEADGTFCVPLRCDVTTTQATCNGGSASRANAYIDMSKCTVFENGSRPRRN